MAINTRNKRASAVEVGLIWRGMLPVPSGSISIGTRAMIAAFYAGFNGISVSLTGVFATGTLGTLTVTGAANIFPTTVFATGELGDLVVAFSTIVFLDGLAANAFLGNLLIWNPVPPGPPGNWVPVPDGTDGGWIPVP